MVDHLSRLEKDETEDTKPLSIKEDFLGEHLLAISHERETLGYADNLNYIIAKVDHFLSMN